MLWTREGEVAEKADYLYIRPDITSAKQISLGKKCEQDIYIDSISDFKKSSLQGLYFLESSSS